MSTPSRDEEERDDTLATLTLRLQSRGYTPGLRDLPALFEYLGGSRELAKAAERALLRAQHPLCEEIASRSRTAEPSLRARLTRLASRRGKSEPSAALESFLLERLLDDDDRTRRSAAAGLGRMRGPEVLRALVARCAIETNPAVLAELATGLGKMGGEEAEAALGLLAERDAFRADDALRSTVERASLIHRRSKPASESRVVLDAAPEQPLSVAVHCRPGLEALLRSDLCRLLGDDAHPDIVAPGTVRVSLAHSPTRLQTCRLMTEFGFLVRAPRVEAQADSAAFAELVASDRVWDVLRRWTSGTVRYRLTWMRAGKRRKMLWDVVVQAGRLRPALENAPSQSPWEIRLEETPHELIAELKPRYDDRRFSYRRQDVPAASHPTVAAALIRIAEVKSSDVVWDPFVGSGLELCEAWLAARPHRLIGSDIDPDALTAARANLESVGAKGVELRRANALDLDDIRPTSIVTNPPLGRRVLRGQDVKGTLTAFVRHAADLLVPGGHLTWISPHPEATSAVAREVGLEVTHELHIDLGGIEGTVQRFRKRVG